MNSEENDCKKICSVEGHNQNRRCILKIVNEVISGTVLLSAMRLVLEKKHVLKQRLTYTLSTV